MIKATIEYDFQENPSKAVENDGARCHVRIQNNQTVTSEEISERLKTSSTLSNVDFQAVLAGLEDVIAEELACGNAVSLGNLCRFEAILGTQDKCDGSEKGNAIQLKKVRVRPSRWLTKTVRENLRPCKRTHAKHSPKIGVEDVLAWMTEHFKTNSFVKRIQLEKGLGLTRSLAAKYVRELVSDGILLHPEKGNDPLYFPSEKLSLLAHPEGVEG